MVHACMICRRQAKYKVFTYDGQIIYLCEDHVKGWHSKRITELKTFGESIRDLVKDGWKIKESPRFYAVESWKRMFWFVAKFPKVLLFTVIVQLIMFAGTVLIILATYVFLKDMPITWTVPGNIDLSPYLSILQKTVNFLGDVPVLSNPWAQLVVGFIVVMFASLMASAGYPVIISYGFEQGRIDLMSAFKEGTARILDVLLYVLVMAGIFLTFPIGIWLSATKAITSLTGGAWTLGLISGITVGLIYIIAMIYVSFKLSLELGCLLAFALGFESVIIINPFAGIILSSISSIILLYLIIRLSLVLPVLIVEKSPKGGKLRLSEAFSYGIAHTNGKVRSIFGMWVLFFATVILPLSILSWFYFGSFIAYSYWVAVIWTIIVQILIGTSQAILPTVYYFTTIRRAKL